MESTTTLVIADIYRAALENKCRQLHEPSIHIDVTFIHETFAKLKISFQAFTQSAINLLKTL